jgi:uncharacterized protein
LARSIVAFRDSHGPFNSREILKEVPRLGPKAFEQAAGFLRIADAANPLDESAVHPESYPVVDAMAADLHCTVQDLVQNESLRKKVDIKQYVSDRIGLPTLTDIIAELAKPGRDPRKSFEVFSFADHVTRPEDLRQGMRLPGIVTNVTKFGAFVDIGVHQDGLVHISEMADRFIKDPAEVVKVQQNVVVTVLDVDLARKRISLSLRGDKKPEKIKDAALKKPSGAAKALSKKNRANSKGPAKPAPFHNPLADALKGLGKDASKGRPT